MLKLLMDHARTKVHWRNTNITLKGLWCSLGSRMVKRYSTILFDFTELSLTFTKEGKSVSFKGITDSVERHLIGSDRLRKVFKEKIHKLMGFLFSITIAAVNQICFPPLISLLIRESHMYLVNPRALPPVRAHDNHNPLLSTAKLVNLRVDTPIYRKIL